MKITILSVGKIKEKYLKDAIGEYSKRLSAYCTLQLIEVPDEKAPENLSDKDMELIKEKEGRRLLEKLKDSQHLIVLDIKGKQHTSEAFSKQIETLQIQGKSDLAFIIGGSLGLSKEVLDRANDKLSFSKMTFPHQLMKVILLEQVYRAYRIMRNEPYHK